MYFVSCLKSHEKMSGPILLVSLNISVASVSKFRLFIETDLSLYKKYWNVDSVITNDSKILFKKIVFCYSIWVNGTYIFRGQWLNWNLKKELNRIYLPGKCTYCVILQKQPTRSSHRKCCVKKDVIYKETPTQVFSCEYLQNF